METLVNHFSESLQLLSKKMVSWLDAIVVSIPNMIIALLVGLFAYFISTYVKKLSKKLTSKFTTNKTILNLVANLSSFVLSILALFIILSIFDLGGTINKILATAGVLGLAIGLALQDPMNNLFSGVFMSVEELYKIDDLIETNGFFGTIKSIDLRFTRMKLLSGEEVIIPNKSVLQSPLTNYTISGQRRVEIECGVSYGDNLETVERVVLETISSLENNLEDKPSEFMYTGYGDSSVNFKARFWIKAQGQADFLKKRSIAIKAIFNAFNDNDIMIPFPIRTLDFGIKGGVQLNSMLQPK